MHTKMIDKFIKAFILCILQGKPNIQFYFIELSWGIKKQQLRNMLQKIEQESVNSDFK